MEITINNQTYEVVRNVKDALNEAELKEKLTDYFDNFDYVLGDYAYGKLRLKGFNEETNKNCKSYNNIANVDTYLKENCAYGCHYFLLKKVKGLQ